VELREVSSREIVLQINVGKDLVSTFKVAIMERLKG
jgi:hypothetical protein